ncbi:MAG: cation transporter [Candidatus Omnitrophica bacterium]|nr:cation transporter [Candidatus Omnitrophota bacterium]
MEHFHDLHLHPPRSLARKKLLWSIGLTGTMMVVEVIGGVLTNSLALLSDAGHMLTHFSALLVSFLAMVYAGRPAEKEKSFGFYRLEILAALLNSFILFVITFFIFVEAFKRIQDPRPIRELQMFLVAVVGLGVNLLSAKILSGSAEDLNVKSAFLHMLGDTASSFGIVLGAIAIHFTQKPIIDPLLSVLIGVLILIWSWRLLRDSCHILLESSPRHIKVDEVVEAVRSGVQEVKDLHDVHIWEITSKMYAMTAHAIVEDMKISESSAVLDRINHLVENRFEIGHTNIQFELKEGEKVHHHEHEH